MTAQIVSKFNPLTLSSFNGNVTAVGTENGFSGQGTLGVTNLGTIKNFIGTVNTKLTPGIGGWCVWYNQTPVNLNLLLPDGSSVYLPSKFARKFLIQGPKVTIDFGVEDTPISFALINSLNGTPGVPPQNIQAICAWNAVVVETYSLDDTSVPDWDMIYLDTDIERLWQWQLRSVSNVNNTTNTITNFPGGGSIIFIKQIHLGFQNTATAASYSLQVQGIDNVDSGSPGTLIYTYPIGTTGNIQTPFLDLYYEPPIASVTNTDVKIVVANHVGMGAVSLVVRYLIQ